MENIKIECQIKKVTSKKNNKDYYIVSVPITEMFNKDIFLDNATAELIKVIYNI